MVRRYDVCGLCKHTSAYCRCESVYSWPLKPRMVSTGKDALLTLIDEMEEDGKYMYAAVLKINLPIALDIARAEGTDQGFEVGYDAARESVGEWLERSEP